MLIFEILNRYFMKNINLGHLLAVCSLAVAVNRLQGQSKEYLQTINWFSANNIEINNPTPPKGFKKFLDCDSHVVYKKVIGDTILFYKFAFSMATKFEEVIKIHKRPYFNTTVFPQMVLETGAVIVTRMVPNIFLIRNDSLYLLDNSERKLFNATKMIDDFQSKAKENIDSLLVALNEFVGDAALQWQDTQELDNLKGTESIWSGEHPDYFKVVFHKKMFLQSNTIVFQRKPIEFEGKKASAEERVDLLREWKQQGKQCYYIRVYGDFGGTIINDLIFASDGTFLDLENCQANKASIFNSIEAFKPPGQKNK
jgi:hypothetical protein